MSATIGVTQDLAEQVTEFVKAETLALEVVSAGSGTIEIVRSEDQQQSDPSTLQAGGWVTCTDAFAVASKLGLPTRTMGKFLNLLDIKIRECQLGCF